jgi:hypothetical protein
MEEIQVNVGVEQEVSVVYGDEELTITLLFNDYFDRWFMNLSNETNDLLKGISMPLGVDVLFGQGLPYGELMLIDTGGDEDLNMKDDLGNRVKLVRNV